MKILKTAAIVIGAVAIIASGGVGLASVGAFGAAAKASVVAGTGFLGAMGTVAVVGAMAAHSPITFVERGARRTARQGLGA
jgi:hypothetical protein